MTHLSLLTAFILLLSLTTPHLLYASGFGIFSQSAASFGQGGSSIAHSDSPSSIFYNPALINDLEGTQIELGTTIIKLAFEHKSRVTGVSGSNDDDLFFPSTMYVTHRLNEKISLGLGVFSPFGLATDWEKNWEGRYLATTSELTSLCVNPVLSYKISPKVSVAAGVDFIYLDASLENNINFAPFGLTDGHRKFSGDGTGYGYNIGLLYRPTDTLALGASYRSAYTVDLDGQVTFDLPGENPFILPVLAATLPNTRAETTLELPQIIFAGIACKVMKKLTVETGILWEGWSAYKEIKTKFYEPVNGTDIDITVKNWKDTITTNIGLEYIYNDHITLRTGYLYRENAIPDNTFDPSLPDADAHLFTVGSGFKWDRYTLSLAYVYEKQKDREKNNTLGDELGGNANGTYSSDIHFLAISLNMQF